MNQRHLKALHELVTGNRELIATAGAGCCTKCNTSFYFDPAATTLDDRELLNDPDGFTVVCPKCGCDAVLPSNTAALVNAISAHWHN
jgi:hypothetical protein